MTHQARGRRTAGDSANKSGDWSWDEGLAPPRGRFGTIFLQPRVRVKTLFADIDGLDHFPLRFPQHRALWLGLAPSQAPQSARREDEGEAPEPAERPECPDEEKAA